MQSIGRHIWLGSVFSALLVLSGCGGGGGSSSNSNSNGGDSGVTTTAGGAVDGYLQGATVFADKNANGSLEESDISTTTNASGDFSLSGEISNGTKVYAYGGIDLSTGYAFEGKLSTVYDSTRLPVILSPLTTYVTALVENGSDYATATQQVADSLGLSAEDIDKDPMTQTDLFFAAQKVQKTVEVIAAAKGEADFNEAYTETFASLATLTTNSPAPFDGSTLVQQVEDDGTVLDPTVAVAVSGFLDVYVATVDDLEAENVNVDDLDTYGEVLNAYTEVVEGSLESGDAANDIATSVTDTQTTLADVNTTQVSQEVEADTYSDPLVDDLKEVEDALALLVVPSSTEGNIPLSVLENGLTVTWESSDTSVITTTGTVTQDLAVAKNVTLTATVSNATVTNNRTFSVTVSREEVAPTAANINLIVTEDIAREFEVEKNDANGDSTTIQSVSTPSNGTAVINVNNIIYTPNANFNGNDSFTYTVIDSTGLTGTGTASVTVNAINDEPTISTINDLSIFEDQATANIPFTISDVETASESLVVTATSNNTGLVANNAITINGTGSNRTIMLTPVINAFGQTTITVNVTDGDIVSSETFTLQVNEQNDAPTITPISDVNTQEDSQSTANVQFGDVDSSSWTVTASSNNPTLIPTANIAVSVPGDSAILTLTPLANAFGTAIITVTVDDEEGGIETATFFFNVSAVNDKPEAFDDTATVKANSNTNEVFVLANDIDVDNAVEEISVVSCTAPNNSGTVDDSVYPILYAPAVDFSGTETFTCTISDGNLTDSALVTVTVNPQNSAPEFASNMVYISMIVGETLTVQVEATDPDGDTISYALLNRVNITAEITSEGILSLSALSLPAEQQSGSLEIEATDGDDFASVIYVISISEDTSTPAEDEYSNDERITQAQYDNYTASATEVIPVDVKMYGIWGSDTSDLGVKIYDVDYHEFQTFEDKFYMSDEPDTIATHSISGTSSTAIIQDESYNNLAEFKLLEIRDSASLEAEFGKAMPVEAEAYVMAVLDFNEDYYFGEWVALDYTVGPDPVAYNELTDMTTSNAVISQQSSNYNRAIIFSDTAGVVKEVDLSGAFNGADAYVLDANAGTWEFKTVDIDGTSVEMVFVTLDTDVVGYDDQYPLLAKFDGDAVTDTVHHGDYTPANSGWHETYFNEEAKVALTGEEVSSASFDLVYNQQSLSTVSTVLDTTTFKVGTTPEDMTMYFDTDNNGVYDSTDINNFDGELEVSFNVNGTGTLIFDTVGSRTKSTITWEIQSSGILLITESEPAPSDSVINYRITAVSGVIDLVVESTIVVGDPNDGFVLQAWSYDPRTSSATNLIGSWLFDEDNSGTKRNIFTFIDDTHYIIFHEHADTTGGTQTAGSSEYGTYTWDSSTGAFNITSIIGETDGDGGMSDNGFDTITAHEGSFTLSGTNESDIVFNKVEDDVNKMIGTWTYNKDILVFFSAVDYAIIHTGPEIQSQQYYGEFGTYLEDSQTDNLMFTAVVDTDDIGGFSDIDFDTAWVSPATIYFITSSGDAFKYHKIDGFSLKYGDEDRGVVTVQLDDGHIKSIGYSDFFYLDVKEDLDNSGSVDNEVGMYSIVFNKDGSGSIDFGGGNINNITWTKVSDMEVKFTQIDDSGNRWDYTITAYIHTDDSYSINTLNAVIEIDASENNSIGARDDNTLLGHIVEIF